MAHASQILQRIAALGLRWAEEPIAVVYSPYSRSKGQTSLGALAILADLTRDRLGAAVDDDRIRAARRRALAEVEENGPISSRDRS